MNLIELNNKFPTELDAIKHFEQARWGDTPKCAYCESEDLGNRNQDHRFFCRSCNKTGSVTTNTYLHNTRLPLKTWLMAFSIITDAKKGLSARQLKRHIGVHWETAWAMYHKIREIMVDPPVKLDDIVEMDAAYVGGKPRKGWYMKNADKLPEKERKRLEKFKKEQAREKVKVDKQLAKLSHKRNFINPHAYKKPLPIERPKRGKGTKKVPIIGVVERQGNVIAEVMEKINYQELKEFIEANVNTAEEESVLITDKDKAHYQLGNVIDHIMINHKVVLSHKGVNTNSIESFWAIIKRGITGQYHHVSRKHLPKYIMEFVFKYNNRNEDDMFETLVRNSMKHKKNNN